MATSEGTRLGIGKVGFVEQHGLAGDGWKDAADRALATVREQGLRTVRVIWVDQHGVPRCKFISAHDFEPALSNGIDFSGALLSMDTGNHLFPPVFVEGGGFGLEEMTGFPDVVLIPDPTTFTVLPFADRTGWVLTNCYFANGKPVPFSAREVLQAQVAAAAEMGFDYLSGLEVEFYIVRRDSDRIELDETGWPPPPMKVSVFEQGYQYLSEVRLGNVNATLTVLRDAFLDMGLPLRSMEDEWGPGQMEFTFDPVEGMGSADHMILFRSATKQICHQLGLHATFMCRPNLPNFFSSGWHLHESLLDRKSGENAFASTDGQWLSEVGRLFTAGLLEHAMPMTVFTTPTVNGYRRFRPYSFAPDRVTWAMENRGTMVRVQGQPGEKSAHIENRLGEPAANPYLYLAANIAAGLDGIRSGVEPPPPVEADPYAADAPMLPTSLKDATDALEKDTFFRGAFGDALVDFIVMNKRGELKRFEEEEPNAGEDVTDWEMREYFEFY